MVYYDLHHTSTAHSHPSDDSLETPAIAYHARGVFPSEFSYPILHHILDFIIFIMHQIYDIHWSLCFFDYDISGGLMETHEVEGINYLTQIHHRLIKHSEILKGQGLFHI